MSTWKAVNFRFLVSILVLNKSRDFTQDGRSVPSTGAMRVPCSMGACVLLLTASWPSLITVSGHSLWKRYVRQKNYIIREVKFDATN